MPVRLVSYPVKVVNGKGRIKASRHNCHTMGNIQSLQCGRCGSPSVYDETFDVFVKRSKSDEDALWTRSETLVGESNDSFLEVHPPGKWILDPTEVSKALIDQAVELLKRTMDDEDSVCSQEGDIDTVSQMEISSPIPFEQVSSLNSVAAAPSVITRASAATETVANNARFSTTTKRKKPPSKENKTPKLKGNSDFTRNEKLKRHIQKVLKQAGVRNSLQQFQLNKGDVIGCKTAIPNILQHGNRGYDPEHTQKIMKHTSVLHLKFVPHCVTYYQTQLSRLLPDNAVTLAVTNSITSTNMSPPREARSKAQPDPVSFSSDDSSSSSSGIAFGVGPPSYPIRLLASDTSFMDLAITGSLGLIPNRSDKLSKRSHSLSASPEQKRLKSPDHYIVLLNRRSGVPLAVCALKSTTMGGPLTVRIFSTKRRFSEQNQAATTQQLGLNWPSSFSNDFSLPLYTFAEICAQGAYPGRVRYSIYMATGSNGNFEQMNSYSAVHECLSSPEIRVVGRTEREQYHSGCAILSMCTNEDSAIEDDVFFRLSISKGIDPALIICLAAFIDEVLEKTMRIQSSNLSESIYRMA